jgi:hypothetical protein
MYENNSEQLKAFTTQTALTAQFSRKAHLFFTNGKMLKKLKTCCILTRTQHLTAACNVAQS